MTTSQTVFGVGVVASILALLVLCSGTLHVLGVREGGGGFVEIGIYVMHVIAYSALAFLALASTCIAAVAHRPAPVASAGRCPAGAVRRLAVALRHARREGGG